MKEKYQYEILKFDRIIVKSERSSSLGKEFIWFYIDFSSNMKADLFCGIAFFSPKFTEKHRIVNIITLYSESFCLSLKEHIKMMKSHG